LHAELERVDPVRATEIDPRNVRRVIRALEIFKTTGIPPSQQRKKNPPSFPILRIGLHRPRAELYQRIDQRLEEMLAQGWVEEVRTLIVDPEIEQSPAMSAIGYQEIAMYLRGDSSLDECVAQIKKLNRQYVRRQANWFKLNDPDINWFEVSVDPLPPIVQCIEGWLET
jgi:tRNA dimethylallyltransferase